MQSNNMTMMAAAIGVSNPFLISKVRQHLKALSAKVKHESILQQPGARNKLQNQAAKGRAARGWSLFGVSDPKADEFAFSKKTDNVYHDEDDRRSSAETTGRNSESGDAIDVVCICDYSLGLSILAAGAGRSIKVTGVSAGSPCQGLLGVGDMIEAVDDKVVYSVATLRQACRGLPGSELSLKIRAGGNGVFDFLSSNTKTLRFERSADCHGIPVLKPLSSFEKGSPPRETSRRKSLSSSVRLKQSFLGASPGEDGVIKRTRSRSLSPPRDATIWQSAPCLAKCLPTTRDACL